MRSLWQRFAAGLQNRRYWVVFFGLTLPYAAAWFLVSWWHSLWFPQVPPWWVFVLKIVVIFGTLAFIHSRFWVRLLRYASGPKSDD